MSSHITPRDLAKMIDHSLLHPTMTDANLEAGCELAVTYDVATVCIKPYAVPDAAERLAGSDVAVCAVAGFPHGNSHTETIIAEAERACREGAAEIDMVSNTGRVLGEDWDYVSGQIKAVNDAVVGLGGLLKVIFENDFLEDDQIVRLCELCTRNEVAFAKTSTGYGFVKQDSGTYTYKGAQDHHLKLMRENCGPNVQIKAAGGVRTLDDLLRVRQLGVTRIGATTTAAILEAAKTRFGLGETKEAAPDGH